MSDREREIYESENGDEWFLCRDDDGDQNRAGRVSRKMQSLSRASSAFPFDR
jgi:hypothetical protein